VSLIGPLFRDIADKQRADPYFARRGHGKRMASQRSASAAHPATGGRRSRGCGDWRRVRLTWSSGWSLHREMRVLTERSSTGTCAIAESAAAPREETPRKTWARLRRRLRPHQGSYMRPRYSREPSIRSNRPLPLATSTAVTPPTAPTLAAPVSRANDHFPPV
jgi:hypothetical protein